MYPSDYHLKINDHLYLDSNLVSHCYARYANDNKDVPNGNNSKFELEDDGADGMHEKCFIVALRDILVDEEIFVSYGPGYWNQHQSKKEPKARQVKTVKRRNVSIPVSSAASQNPNAPVYRRVAQQEPEEPEEQKEEHPQGLRRSKRLRKK